MTSPPATVYLRHGRARSVRGGHPWVLSGAVERVEGEPGPGDTVRVIETDGEPIGWGDWDPGSQIRVRLHHFGPEAAAPDEDWAAERLRSAIAWREANPLLAGTDALRWANAEADGLPGLTIDRYADWAVLKPAAPAMSRRAPLLADALMARGLEGVWLRGSPGEAGRGLAGEVPEEPVAIDERGRRYVVDLRHGQKTGFYLDQRNARDQFQQLATGRRALDLYAYSGGFTVAALAGGAREVIAVESSKPALDLLERNAPGATRIQSDVADVLGDRGIGAFDLIAVDPPPFARRKRDAANACRAYRELNRRVFARAAPGACVFTWSCSHHVDPPAFQTAVRQAAQEARADVQLLAVLGAPPDHPVSLVHPQGSYLKGLLLRVAGTHR